MTEVEIAGADRPQSLAALGDQVMRVLIGGRVQRLQAEVIDDEQTHAHERGNRLIKST